MFFSWGEGIWFVASGIALGFFWVLFLFWTILPGRERDGMHRAFVFLLFFLVLNPALIPNLPRHDGIFPCFFLAAATGGT